MWRCRIGKPGCGQPVSPCCRDAVEGRACRAHDEDERIQLGHKLPRIWKAFKEHYDPSNQLVRFDALVRSLHKYEDIRYPETIVQHGMASSFQFGSGPPPKATGKASRNVPTFHLAVGEVEAMVKAICVIGTSTPRPSPTAFRCERMPNICYQPPMRRECCGFDRGWFLRLAFDQPDDLIVGSAGKHR